MKPHIIRDTREQTGWMFPESDRFAGTIIQTLKTADYSLEGFEDVLLIERKGSVSEFANNLIDKRFYRELDRMAPYTFPYLLLEFSLRDMLNFPIGAGIPKYRLPQVKMTGQLLLCKFAELQLKYPMIHTWFCGSQRDAEIAAISIFKRVLDVKSCSN